MPYPGIPEKLTARMDRCVLAVSNRPDFKSKYSNPQERKSHAIAICHASIVDSKKIEDSINDLVKRKEVKNMNEDILEDFAKVYENEGLEAFSDADLFKLAPAGSDDIAKAKFSACMREQVKSGKNFKEAAKACQMPAKDEDEDEEEDEAKAKKADGKSEEEEGEESKKVVKAKKAKKPDPDQAEEDQEEEDEDEEAKKAKGKEEDEDEDEDEEETQKSNAPSIIGVLKEALRGKDVGQMKIALKKAQKFLAQNYGDLKPAKEEREEGVMPADKASKVDGAVAAVEQALAKLEDVQEENPALAKLDSVLEKVDGIAKTVSKLEKRLEVIEEQPADSKVSSTAVVVKKSQGEEENPRVVEINGELKKLEEVKTYDLNKFQNEHMWEKAFDLIAERDQILAK